MAWGRTMIQDLFEELKQGGFTFDVEQDGDGCLIYLFFSHPSSIALTKSYTNVFVMDCTYKTNKYKMTLLNIIGVTSFNTSFYLCFVFLKKEGEDDYIWALQMFRNILGRLYNPSVIVTDRELALMNAIKAIFPTTKNLLCDWNIDKNILAHCKSFFGAQEDFASFLSTWKKVASSHSEAAYEETWEFLKLVYKDKEKLTRYITNTWIPFKEYFVKAWTEEYTHFGNRVTSRAEGAHWKLKQYLQVSTGDLHRVKNKICLAIENEWKETTSQLSSARIHVPHRFKIPFFVEVVTRGSTFAMDELLKQYEMVTKGTMHMTCTRHFNKSISLPPLCTHDAGVER